MAEEHPQPLQPFSEVQNEVRRLFQELIYQPWGARSASAATGWQPCCDMAETEEAIVVEIELPGVERTKRVTVSFTYMRSEADCI